MKKNELVETNLQHIARTSHLQKKNEKRKLKIPPKSSEIVKSTSINKPRNGFFYKTIKDNLLSTFIRKKKKRKHNKSRTTCNLNIKLWPFN